MAAPFDVIESAGKGYSLVWSERSYLMRLALLPALIKLMCFSAVIAFGWEHAYLRQALVMLPSYFAEGWLLSHLVRFIFFQQRWPFRSTGDKEKDVATLKDRARGITAGTVFYVLIRFLQNGLFAFVREHGEPLGAAPMETTAQEPSLLIFIIALLMLVFTIWAFRFFWLFIPAALNYSVKRFLQGLGGFSTSVYMVGTWLICFVPLVFLLLAITAQLLSMSGADATAVPFTVSFVVGIVQVIIDTLVIMVTTAGMAYAVGEMMQDMPASHSR
jgi:hypothetical protein